MMRWNDPSLGDQCTPPLVGDLRLAVDWPVWAVVVGAVAVGILTMGVYLRETKTLPSPWCWLLPGIRGTAVVLACLMLAGPTWHRRQVIGTPTRVTFAIDRSESMAESDSQAVILTDDTGNDSASRRSGITRLRRATDQLFGSANRPGWIERLSKTHLIEVVVFDQASKTVWDSTSSDRVDRASLGDRSAVRSTFPSGYDSKVADWLETADGFATDLSSPLLSSLNLAQREASVRTNNDESNRAESNRDRSNERSPAQRVLVMMSDGRDSVQRSDAASAALKLAQTGWQIHTVGIGSLEEPPDVGIVDIDVPQRVADDGRLAGRIYLKHFGLEGRVANVQVRSGDRVVWSETVSIDSNGKTPIDFDFPVDQLMAKIRGGDRRGVDRDSVVLPLTAEVSMAPDSSLDNQLIPSTTGNTGNDSVDFRVAAASRDRELLILDGSSRWEIRYVRNLFTRDPAWRVDTVLFGEGTDRAKVQRGEAPGQLPGSTRAWSRYDAVVLGEIPPDQWTRQDSSNLAEFVSRGGGLIVIDGRYDRIKALLSDSDSATDSTTTHPMAELIPVRFDDRSTSSRRAVIEAIEPTESGVAHPVMMIDSESKPVTKAWQHLPAPQRVSGAQALVDAEVWAETVDETGRRQVWLATRLFGAGRVFYLASDETWRWRYKLESRLHRRFWSQLMTAVMQPPYAVRDEFVAIGTDKIDYEIGQPAIIRARLLQENAGSRSMTSPIDVTTVDALLLQNEQVIATIPMRLEDPQRRTYVAQTLPLDAGQYDVRIRASGYDASALKASSPIWVQASRSGELDRTSVDESSLQRIAGAGGGTYVHESAIESLFDQISPLSRGRILESDTAVWQSWWTFILILVLLTMEWWARKKVGLM